MLLSKAYLEHSPVVCFSYQADLAAAAVLAPIGLVTLRAARTTREVPIAATPLFFAAHQFVESFVWLGTDGRTSPEELKIAIYLYLAMAQMVLPLYIPLAVALLEPARARRRWIIAAAVVGAVVAARFGWILETQGATAYPAAHTMVYKTPVEMGVLGGIGYLTATCFATLMSSQRVLRLLGAVNLAGVGLAALVRYEAVTSVWCVYAALASALVLLQLRLSPDPRQAIDGGRGRRQPWTSRPPSPRPGFQDEAKRDAQKSRD